MDEDWPCIRGPIERYVNRGRPQNNQDQCQRPGYKCVCPPPAGQEDRRYEYQKHKQYALQKVDDECIGVNGKDLTHLQKEQPGRQFPERGEESPGVNEKHSDRQNGHYVSFVWDAGLKDAKHYLTFA